jgi:hypothetical protein
MRHQRRNGHRRWRYPRRRQAPLQLDGKRQIDNQVLDRLETPFVGVMVKYDKGAQEQLDLPPTPRL